MRPCGLSIAVRCVRPIFGSLLVNRPCSQSAAPSPRHAVLGEVRALAEADPLAHGPRLLADALERVRAVERDVLDRFEAGPLEPQRMLEPEPGAPHRVVLGEAVVDRRRVQRARRRQLLVRERDAEPARVVLADLGVGVGERRPVAVAGDVHRPDVVVRVAVDHPVGERQTDAAALRQAGHHRARHPHPAHAADRPDERVAVGAERERAVDEASGCRPGRRRGSGRSRARARGRCGRGRGRAAGTRSPTASPAATTACCSARTCRAGSTGPPGGQ